MRPIEMKCSKSNCTTWIFLLLVPGVLAAVVATMGLQSWAQDIVIHEEVQETTSETAVAEEEPLEPEEEDYLVEVIQPISGLDKTKDLGAKGEIVIESLDLIEADLGNVLRAIGRLAGLNIIAGEEVSGIVTVYWENVTVQQALSSILTTNDYGYIYEGNILKVLPAKKLGEDRINTITRVVTLQYLNAEEMQEAIEELTGSSGASGGGGSGSQQGSGSLKVGLQMEANSLIITGTPREVEEIVNIIRTMDTPTKQVRIEARLIELNYQEESAVGMDWSVYRDLNKLGDYGAILGSFNLAPGGNPTGVFDFAYGKDPYTLLATLQAQYGEDHVKVLANPNILALDNQEAVIQILDQRPYITVDVSQGVLTETVNYQETGITLLVTPHITDDGHVRMHVKPTQRIAGPTIVLQNSTAFNVNERTAETDLLVKDGSTVVIGGLKRTDQQKSIRKVPLLGDIPAIGKLFTRQSVQETETELVVFVTPHIIQLGEVLLSEKENEYLRRADDSLKGIDKIQRDEERARIRKDTPVYRVHMEQSLAR